MTATREAEFLFGPKIEEIWKRANNLSYAKQQKSEALSGAPADDRNESVEAVLAEGEWARQQLRELADKFKDYLDFSRL